MPVFTVMKLPTQKCTELPSSDSFIW